MKNPGSAFVIAVFAVKIEFRRDAPAVLNGCQVRSRGTDMGVAGRGVGQCDRHAMFYYLISYVYFPGTSSCC